MQDLKVDNATFPFSLVVSRIGLKAYSPQRVLQVSRATFVTLTRYRTSLLRVCVYH